MDAGTIAGVKSARSDLRICGAFMMRRSAMELAAILVS